MIEQKPSEALGARLEELQRRLSALGDGARARYTAEHFVIHYRRLAERLERDLADPVLTDAGFCHGAWGRVEPERIAAVAGPLVRSVLETWDRLRKLDGGELASVVAEEPRAAFLCIYERLDRVDPEESLVTWEGARTRWDEKMPEVAELEEDEAMQFIHGAASAARIAELVGQWPFKNAIEDAALQLSNPALVDRVSDFVFRRSRPDGYPSQCASAVAALLADGDAPYHEAPRWRWRHGARIATHLAAARPGVDAQEAPAFLTSCGYVMVVCESDAAYRILERLHARAAHYASERFFDSVGHPTKDGYRALHTGISVEVRGRLEPIQVRIEPRPSTVMAHHPSVRDLLVRQFQSGPRGSGRFIRVTTPRGGAYDVPVGAPVLAFAASVHNDLAAFVQGAIINNRVNDVVDVLHPLNDGDCVELVLSGEPQIPPDDWEQRLPGWAHRPIRRGLRRGFAAHFRAEGLAWVRKRLESKGFVDVDDAILTPLLEWATVDVPLPAIPSNPIEVARVDWVLQQLGIARTSERGVPVAVKSLLSLKTIKVIADKLDETLAEFKIAEGPITPDNERLRQKARAIRFCDECNAREARRRAVVPLRDGTLLVHRYRGGECAHKARPITIVQQRFATLNQYFVVETTNRVGIAEEILGVFRAFDVDVTDLAGRKLGPGWGVVRVGVGVVGPSKVKSIAARLVDIPGAQRVRLPTEGRLPIVEDWLPPRAGWSRETDLPGRPYHVGGEIFDDRYFYGRISEMVALDSALRDAEQGPGGVMAFVLGPLKTGKSSLVVHFMRQLQAKESDVITLRYVAGEEPWSAVEPRLCALLVEKVQEHARNQKLPPPPELSGGLAAMLFTLRRWEAAPRVVIVVDEMVRVLHYMNGEAEAQAEESHRGLSNFRRELNNLPRVLIVLIGPAAPTLKLRGVLRGFVNSARRIPVSAFSLQDARALIEARNLANIFQIGASDQVVRDAYKATGGDPFWLAHLADKMWEQAGRERVYFEGPHLEAARRSLVAAEHVFLDRVDPQPSERLDAELLRRIAVTIARLGDVPGEEGVGVVHEPALREALATGGQPIDTEVLGAALVDLAARGALTLDGPPGEFRRMRIAAPLLAENLRVTSKKKEARPAP